MRILAFLNLTRKSRSIVERAIRKQLARVESDKDLYLLAKAIAPDSIVKSWSRDAILDTIEDVLLSRA